MQNLDGDYDDEGESQQTSNSKEAHWSSSRSSHNPAQTMCIKISILSSNNNMWTNNIINQIIRYNLASRPMNTPSQMELPGLDKYQSTYMPTDNTTQQAPVCMCQLWQYYIDRTSDHNQGVPVTPCHNVASIYRQAFHTFLDKQTLLYSFSQV